MYLSEPRVHSLSAMGEPYPALSAPAKRRGNGEDLRANGQPVNIRALPKANAKAYGLRPSERMWVWLGGLNAGPNCVASCIIKSPSWLTLGRASCTEHSAKLGAMLSTRAKRMHVYRLEVRRLWGCSPNFYPVEIELAQALDLWPKESEGRSIIVIGAKPLHKDEPVKFQHLSDPFVVLYGQFANWGETPLEYLERHPHYWQKKPFAQELSAAILAHAGPPPSEEENFARSREAYIRSLCAEEDELRRQGLI